MHGIFLIVAIVIVLNSYVDVDVIMMMMCDGVIVVVVVL